MVCEQTQLREEREEEIAQADQERNRGTRDQERTKNQDSTQPKCLGFIGKRSWVKEGKLRAGEVEGVGRKERANPKRMGQSWVSTKNSGRSLGPKGSN